MNEEEIKNQIKEYEEKIAELEGKLKDKGEEASKTEDEARLEEIEKEVDDLNKEKAEIEEKRSKEIKKLEVRSKATFNPIASYFIGEQGNKMQSERNDLEKRQAFMNYVLTGKVPEKRDDLVTMTQDTGAVIPNTIIKRVVTELKQYGSIWAKVTKTNFKGGISIPVASLKPVAKWIKQGTKSEKQKYPVDASISFLYFKLQCKVSINLEVDTTTLEIFEDSLVEAMKEAMIVALEQAIISGSGNNEPLGVINHENVKVVEMSEADMRSYEGWLKTKAKVPARYKKRISYILNDVDFTTYIEGLCDKNGRPIGKASFDLNGEEIYKVLGKEAITVEDDILPSFDEAEVGDVFGIIVDLSDYTFNSNLQMSLKRYFDEDEDEWVTKTTLIGDGKLASKQSVVLLKKKATQEAETPIV